MLSFAFAIALAVLPSPTVATSDKCYSPRQSWLTILDHARSNPELASVCLEASEESGADWATRLVGHLDSRGLRISTESAPDEPNYVNSSGEHRYADKVAPQFPLVKIGTKWVVRDQDLQQIPRPLALAVVDHLPSWFGFRLFGLHLWQILGIGILVIVAVLFRKLAVRVFRFYVEGLSKRLHRQYTENLAKRASLPIGGIMMSIAFYVGIPLLLLPLRFSQVGLLAARALFAYSLVWVFFRIIDATAEWMLGKAAKTDTMLDDQLIPLLAKTVKLFLATIIGIFLLQNVGVDVGSLLAGLGLGGLAFALAAKDTIANFFGSVMIFVDKPFQIGDWVVVGDVEGTVEDVGFRTTRIRTFYNSLVSVPNAILTNTSVDNYGLRKFRRYSTTLGLAYDTPPEKIEAFCLCVRGLIANSPGMRTDYFLVEFKEFADSSLNIMLYCFMVASDWGEEMRIRTKLNLDILRCASDLGVSFAFPTQSLHIESMVPSGQRWPSHNAPSSVQEMAAVVSNYTQESP